MAPDTRFEIREKHDGFDVIDLTEGRWLATFQMFADARKFAEDRASSAPARRHSEG